MQPDLHGDGPRGIFCPGCGAAVHPRYIAKSYPAPGGQYRKRHCPTIGCRGFAHGVETLETAIGFEPSVLDISDLSKEDVRALREMIRQMRKLAAIKAGIEDIERGHATRAVAVSEVFGVPIAEDPSVEPGMIEFRAGRQVVGTIVNLHRRHGRDGAKMVEGGDGQP